MHELIVSIVVPFAAKRVAAYGASTLILDGRRSGVLTRALGGEVSPDSGLLALVGAFAFMASDTTLASDRFVRPFRGAQVVPEAQPRLNDPDAVLSEGPIDDDGELW